MSDDMLQFDGVVVDIRHDGVVVDARAGALRREVVATAHPKRPIKRGDRVRVVVSRHDMRNGRITDHGKR